MKKQVVVKTGVREPWLIQRCQIKEKPAVNKTLSQCLRFEYMGSAEFEFGALPANTESLYLKKDKLVVTKYEGALPSRFKKLFILSLKEQAIEYQSILGKLLEDKLRTKEYVFSSYNNDTNLWMDLDNQVIFSTDREFLEKITHLLEGSMKKIQETRALESK